MVVVPAWLLATTLAPVGIAGTVYLVRKLREWQWGWVRNRSSLDGRVYVVTGANTGLGYEATKALAARHATVIMACRSEERATQAIARIRRATSNGKLVFMQLDLAEAASVRQFARQLQTLYPQVDCLVHNAGLAVKTDQQNSDGIELTWATNYLGPFLLTRLLDAAIREHHTRIVIVASTLHQRGTIDVDKLGGFVEAPMQRGRNVYYNNSKLGNFYMGRELYRRGYDAHVLCPGLCHTDFFRDYEPRWYHYVMFAPVVWLMLRSAAQGAQNIVHCATDAVNTAERNPACGYYVRSLRQDRSKFAFSDAVAERLWLESERMCGIAAAAGRDD